MEWWVPYVLEPLDYIIKTVENPKNLDNYTKKFWKYIFKYYGGGGSGVNPSIDGWFINFFPYIDNKPSKWAKRNIQKVINECDAGDYNPAEEYSDSEDQMLYADTTQHGLDQEKLRKSASGINTTPFKWVVNG